MQHQDHTGPNKAAGKAVGIERSRRRTAPTPRHVFLAGAAALFFLGGILLPAAPQVARAEGDPVIAAAGDIACDPAVSAFHGGTGTSTSCRQKYTSDLLVNAGLAAVLDLGDNQYFCGGYQAFLQSYDPSWGRVKSITHPAVGNHEYLTSGGTGCDQTNEGASGYFDYFGSAAGTRGQGYYSFNVGAWHIIALNSSCPDVGGCGRDSPQYNWLRNDLAAHDNYCTLADWHVPLFSSGGRASTATKPFWDLLYGHDVDLILNGHDHIYERFAPQTPAGAADPSRGIREFVVGTGGANHTGIASVAANSEIRNTDTFGVLRLTLHATGYDWQFAHESGKSFSDSGSGTCHGTNPPATSTPNSTPTRTPTAKPTPTKVPSVQRVFLPSADSYVSAANPGANFGGNTILRADGSPKKRSYIRFDVQGLNGAPILGVLLQLYLLNSSTEYLRVRQVPGNQWGEYVITFNSAPAIGKVISAKRASPAGSWITFNVSSYVTGEGTFSFAIVMPGTDVVFFSSRETGRHAPRLIINIGG